MSVVQLKPSNHIDNTAARATLADLHERRRALTVEMTAVRTTIAKVEATPQEEASIRAEIAALDAKESAAAQKWAEDGADGEPPAVDVKVRATLNDRLAGAVAKSAASKAALNALSAKHNDLARAANNLASPIAVAANTVLLDKLEAEVSQAKELIGKLVPLLASIDSGRHVIVEENHRINALGQGHGTQELFQRLERIPGNRELMLGSPSPNLIGGWMRELEALRQGGQP